MQKILQESYNHEILNIVNQSNKNLFLNFDVNIISHVIKKSKFIYYNGNFPGRNLQNETGNFPNYNQVNPSVSLASANNKTADNTLSQRPKYSKNLDKEELKKLNVTVENLLEKARTHCQDYNYLQEQKKINEGKCDEISCHIKEDTSIDNSAINSSRNSEDTNIMVSPLLTYADKFKISVCNNKNSADKEKDAEDINKKFIQKWRDNMRNKYITKELDLLYQVNLANENAGLIEVSEAYHPSMHLTIQSTPPKKRPLFRKFFSVF